MSAKAPPKDAEEKIPFVFNFQPDMETSESISSALLTVAVVAGADGNPAAMLDGASSIVGGLVRQRIMGGITGNTYRVRCKVTLSSGNVFVLAGLLPIREA